MKLPSFTMLSRIKYYSFILGLIALFLGSLSTSGKAQKRYDQLNFPKLNEFNKPEVQTFSLDNGIEFYLVEDQELPLIQVEVKSKTGEIQVADHKLGLSQITGEVMRSGGTKSISSDSLNRLLENNAASMETGIGFSSGGASMNVLKENFNTFMPIFVDLLENPALPKEKIELSKKQLKSQISRRNDDQGQIASREFNRLIYGTHSVYGRLVQYATVNNISRDDVVSFHKQAFEGKDLMVGVVGDFDADTMKSFLTNVFNDYPGGQKNRMNFPEVNYKHQSSVNFIHKSDVNQSLIRMGHIGGKRQNPDYATIQVLNNVLSGGFSGRILQKIRTELGLSYSPHANFGMNAFYPGVFYVSVRTKSSSTAQVIKAVKEVLRNLQKEKISQQELDDAKSQFLNSLVFQYDSHEEVLNRQMDLAYKGLPENALDRFVDSLKQVTREDIQEAARTYLQPEKMEILVVGNKNQIGDQLSQFGEVNTIDISIPQPESQQSQTTKGDTAKGSQWLQRMANALIPEGIKLDQIEIDGKTTQYNSRLPGGEMSMSKSTTIDFPHEMTTDLNTPQGKVTMMLKNGKAQRKINGKVTPMPDRVAKQIRQGLQRNFLNVAQSHDTLTARFQGQEELKDGKYVKLSIELSTPITLYIDPKTNLPYMMSYNRFSTQKGSRVTVKTYYQQWQQKNGIAYPFKQMSFSEGSKVSQTTVDNLRVKNTSL